MNINNIIYSFFNKYPINLLKITHFFVVLDNKQEKLTPIILPECMWTKIQNINKLLRLHVLDFWSRHFEAKPRFGIVGAELYPFSKPYNFSVTGVFLYFLVLVERKIPLFFANVIFVNIFYLKLKKLQHILKLIFDACAVTRKIGQYICKLFFPKVPEMPNKIYTLYLNT